MESLRHEMNFELCREIMLWLEGWLDHGMTVHFDFEGHALENTFYNTGKLKAAGLIYVHGPKKFGRKMQAYWPTGFTEVGRKFLEAAKDESRWAAATEVAGQEIVSETLGPLKAALFRNQG